ncbi:MAG: dihydroorotate dehydrogenase (quinone), partial [Henriciella sp.]|nr:dihydroorotate dehydrogenase (quinone) [Henriciella sp.]
MNLTDLALPVIKILSPEAAHRATIKGLKLGIGLPRISSATWNTSVKLPRSGLKLQNPVGLAAGFDKNADVHSAMARFGFGLLECGTVTPQPQPGNPKPRLFRLNADQAIINRMGFNNRGLDDLAR